jgi:hypothetical protein
LEPQFINYRPDGATADWMTLDDGHTHFILVDDGLQKASYQNSIDFRAAFEKVCHLNSYFIAFCLSFFCREMLHLNARCDNIRNNSWVQILVGCQWMLKSRKESTILR